MTLFTSFVPWLSSTTTSQGGIRLCNERSFKSSSLGSRKCPAAHAAGAVRKDF
ncbi:hypothetical protein PAXRUDRAFT_831880 [Paxillus rubicundulus Ve08.2h10]|uniref:Uncharacterized protein n=1 Tax=Paxillus rubicundulus Ve08.2h10 TaxID=930991 RepID=A0A0D0DWU1_9AGAM|nr:hypothetical protein PAXRUDRAFT_831880 [Paxillus rubicundulus Ve08.2h10]